MERSMMSLKMSQVTKPLYGLITTFDNMAQDPADEIEI